MDVFFGHWPIRCPQIHDGRSAGAHMLGRYCNSIPNITSTHNKIYLWFRSDHSNARSGFALTWNSTDPSMVPVYTFFIVLSLFIILQIYSMSTYIMCKINSFYRCVSAFHLSIYLSVLLSMYCSVHVSEYVYLYVHA
jgi:hypothetical protein